MSENYMKSQHMLQKELQRIQHVMPDLTSLSIIKNKGVFIASTMQNVNSVGASFGEEVYTLLTTAKELTRKLNKGDVYQVMIKEQEGITFITEINTTSLLLTTTAKRVKYGLISLDVKRIAIDIRPFLEGQKD